MSVALLVCLAGIWVLIGVFFLWSRSKKKQPSNR